MKNKTEVKTENGATVTAWDAFRHTKGSLAGYGLCSRRAGNCKTATTGGGIRPKAIISVSHHRIHNAYCRSCAEELGYLTPEVEKTLLLERAKKNHSPNEIALAGARISAALNKFTLKASDLEKPVKSGEAKHVAPDPEPREVEKNTLTEFISIWDRLPKEGAKVLVRCKTETVYRAIYKDRFFESKTESKDGILITRYKATEWAPRP